VPLLADGNLVDQAWGQGRPLPPPAPIRVHPLLWAGQSVAAKLVMLRQRMAAGKADVLLVTMLDEVVGGTRLPFYRAGGALVALLAALAVVAWRAAGSRRLCWPSWGQLGPACSAPPPLPTTPMWWPGPGPARGWRARPPAAPRTSAPQQAPAPRAAAIASPARLPTSRVPPPTSNAGLAAQPARL
jgi:hypothetical protein